MKNLKISPLLKSKMAIVVLAGLFLLASCKKSAEVQQPEHPDAENSINGVNDVWRTANLTNFESYPDPGSEECQEYNGCYWAGQFAFLNGVQPLSWVQQNNIIAVHSKDAGKYKLKTLRLRKGNKTIDAKVYDMCSDSDCGGCCTINANQNGLNFLIDIEKFSMNRFGSGSGTVEWKCLDCG